MKIFWLDFVGRRAREIPVKVFLLILSVGLAAVGHGWAEYAVRDGDTMVFLGDSITAARQYSKVIEAYTLLRFPDRKVRFINAGQGGETAKGSLARLEDAVFARGATVVTVAYGVNDIGWGMKADESHKAEYLAAIGELVERCRMRNIRVFICSAAITAEDPAKAEAGFLQRMCDEGLALAASKGAGTIDVQRSMRDAQRRVIAANAPEPDTSKHTRMHAADSVHLNELGQLAMAFAILKGLGAPPEVSSAALDASTGAVTTSTRCQITDVVRTGNELRFTRIDEGLPLNLEPLWTLQGRFIPFQDELNRYPLAVASLPPGRYEVTAGGRPLGTWPPEALAKGVNLASATADPWHPGGPWDAQAHTVKIFTDMRDELTRARRGLASYLPHHPHFDSLRRRTDVLEHDLVTLQREIVQPIPVEFIVRPSPSAP